MLNLAREKDQCETIPQGFALQLSHYPSHHPKPWKFQPPACDNQPESLEYAASSALHESASPDSTRKSTPTYVTIPVTFFVSPEKVPCRCSEPPETGAKEHRRNTQRRPETRAWIPPGGCHE